MEQNETAKWYILHSYPGYEDIVKANLEKLIEKHNLQEKIFEIALPMESVAEHVNGKCKVVQRKTFPCYVFIKMINPNDMWHLITSIKGVTGFVGPLGRPIPLREDEIRKMHLEKVTVVIDVKVGDSVKVVAGPLEGFMGIVEEIDESNGKCRVLIAMFGRQTIIELDITQLERND